MVSIRLKEACVLSYLRSKQTSVLRNSCEVPGRKKQPNLKEGHVLQVRMKISVLILGFYGYIGYN